jgi:hypothetical protein
MTRPGHPASPGSDRRKRPAPHPQPALADAKTLPQSLTWCLLLDERHLKVGIWLREGPILRHRVGADNPVMTSDLGLPGKTELVVWLRKHLTFGHLQHL